MVDQGGEESVEQVETVGVVVVWGEAAEAAVAPAAMEEEAKMAVAKGAETAKEAETAAAAWQEG